MIRPERFCFGVVGLLIAGLAGCGGEREWEVTVENRGDIPCSFVVMLRPDGSSSAAVDAVAGGKTVRLIAGTGDTIVHSVKVVRGKAEQVLPLKASLPAGKAFRIVVGFDGKAETSVVEK
jgi:hypothetical protein